MVVLSMASRRAPNLIYKVKILVGFFQIATVISFLGDISWPSTFQAFIAVFQFINLDFIPWQSIACATALDVYSKMLIVGLVPIALALLLLVFFFLPMFIRDRTDLSDTDKYRENRKNSRRKFWKLVLFTVFLLYPHVSSTVLTVFNCLNLNGEWLLLNDLSIPCWDKRWTTYVGPAIVFTLLYPIGIPVAYYFLLRRYRTRMREVGVILELGFLYEAYNDDAWFMELVDMAHKLFLTSLASFFPRRSQMQVCAVVVSLYMMVILAYNPFVRKGDDRLQLLCLAELLQLAVMGIVLNALGYAQLPKSLDVVLSIGLIFLVVFFFVAFLIISVRNIKKIVMFYRRKKAIKQGKKA